MYSLPNINRLVQKYDKINTRYQTMDALERQEKDLKAKLEFADTLEERKAHRAELRELRKKIFDTPVERSDSMRITLKSSDVITDSNNNVAAKQEVVPSAASRKRDDSAANERLARRTRRAQQMESAKVEIKQEEPARVVENKKYEVPKQQPVANKFTIKTNGFKSNDIANKFEAKTNNDPTGGLRRTGTWSSANRMQSARNEAKTNEIPSKFEPKSSVTNKFTLKTAKPQQNNVQQPAVTKTAIRNPQSVKFNSISAQIKDNESVTSPPAESAGNVNGSGLRRTATWSPGNRAQAPRGVSSALSKLGGPTKKTFGSSYVKGQEDFADSKKERNPYAVNKYTPVTPGVPADKTGMEVSMKPLNKLPTQIQSNNLDGLQKKTNRFTGASTGANNSFRSSNGFVISKKEPATSQREAGKAPGTFNRVGSSRGRPNVKEPATPEPPSPSFGGDKPAQSAADRMAFFRQAAEDEKKKEEAKKEREKRRKEREEQAKKEEEERKKREEEEKKKAEEEKKEEESQDNSNAKKGGAAPCMKKREKKKVVRRTMSIGSIVLDWVQEMVKDYPVEVKNFSSSWNDGMVFCALIHRFNPDAFDFSTLKPENKRENFDLAFDTGAKVKNIPKLLDTEDMVRMAKPEPRSVQCYVQWIWSVFGPTSGYGLTPADVQK